MDGRTSAWVLTFPLALFCAGCVTPQAQKTVTPAPTTTTTVTPRLDDSPPVAVKKDLGPKRNPLPTTEIAFGNMKEAEADSEAGKQNPEAQARLRDEARKAYQHALRIDPSHLEAQRCLARLYVKTGDFERAHDIYKKSLDKHPKDGGLWHDYGMYFKARKELGESVRCFGKAVELDPENPEFLKKLGLALAWTGQVDKSVPYLTRGAGAATAHLWLGRMFDEKDQRTSAIQHLKLALREHDLRHGALSPAQLHEARELLTILEGPAAPAERRS